MSKKIVCWIGKTTSTGGGENYQLTAPLNPNIPFIYIYGKASGGVSRQRDIVRVPYDEKGEYTTVMPNVISSSGTRLTIKFSDDNNFQINDVTNNCSVIKIEQRYL